ncbi:NAD-dependent epimerase/dehydratase family protein [Phytoactinopolyspora mesophila]|uniref:NAD-dependent epimerase/dehydratase family protein n=1 Tax=Phytoactinopolyspora mesophila TaxID=2650750 RepID=A0A7K3M0G8_9ACTN|nr:NAD(P)-dependent oxidoreductase [Phytoactinopolyspora mesophila]NDL55948.1 NAD-dependent epimerase/dehydratase family protein [Phytoactinopolyspora mesophila]
MKRILVTGAAGLIGRTVLRHFTELDVPVTALVLEDPGDLQASRVVVGDAGDRSVVTDALKDVDAVVHLAAIPSPKFGTADRVFSGNTAATFTVLDAAGERGIRRMVIASSINAVGLKFGPHPVHPAYLPFDEHLPTEAADPYSLSKYVDEATAAAMARRHNATVVALRFPMVAGLGNGPGTDDRLPGFLKMIAADPEHGAPDLWMYLEVRDAARAVEAGLRVSAPGAHVVTVAAPLTSAPYPTEQLLDAFHPGVPRRAQFPGREVPADLTVARDLLGFTAEHVVEMPCVDLPTEISRH